MVVRASSKKSAQILATYTVIFAILCSMILLKVNSTVKDSYMDEIFHVPQTKKYYQGEWTAWDAKITTFPGLYIFGGLPACTLRAWNRHCTVQIMRSVNVIWSIACVPVFYHLAISLGASQSGEGILMAIVCSLFPLHFFFSFLYYTDVGSTLFTLSTWLAICHRRYSLAGLLGAVAVLMRQTNAVWIACMTAWAILDMCEDDYHARGGKTKGISTTTTTTNNNNNNNDQLNSPTVFYIFKRLWSLKMHILVTLWPLLSVITLFALFVVYNKGIVVGDKSHHTPVLHYAQLCYFSLFYTLSLAPIHWNPRKIRETIVELFSSKHSMVSLAVIIAAVNVAVTNGTLVHPFLLADNRHYTFYIWRRVISKQSESVLYRGGFILAYVYSFLALRHSVLCAQGEGLKQIVLAGAAFLVLVPAHLIEFRYFTMVFYFAFLQSRGGPAVSTKALVATAIGFILVNAVTLYVFIERPFTWGDGSTARFMW